MNRVMALSLDLIGGSSYVWSAKHLAHHTYPNVTEHDPDIDSLPFARFDPAQHHRPWHRYQHIYIWALYGMITIRWQFMSDFAFLTQGARRQQPIHPPRGRTLATLAGGKGVFVIWAFVIPLIFHPLAWVAVFFLITSVVASLALALVFQLSHCVVETEFIDPAMGSETYSWQIHQIESTVDFAKTNSLLRFYAGGLNHQIEHHLYSRLPHTLYPGSLRSWRQRREPTASPTPITPPSAGRCDRTRSGSSRWARHHRSLRRSVGKDTPAARAPRGHAAGCCLSISVRNPAAIEVVGRQLNLYPISE